MTAEVALLNKHAVALAADSAVTVSGARGNKIYNAANKVFALSKCHPVGAMVYGDAEYMGVPWETIVKVYRHKLGDRSFPTLQDAHADFLSFLGSDEAMFGAKAQEEHITLVVFRKFLEIRESIRTQVDALTKAGNVLDDSRVQAIQAQIINAHRDEVAGAKLAKAMDPEHEAVVQTSFTLLMRALVEQVFEKLPLSQADVVRLIETGVFWLTRDLYLPGAAGVVVAGFGDQEHFPALRSVLVQGRVAGRLKYREVESVTIGVDSTAAVVPFAQTDAVRLFVEGIDPAHAMHATRLVGRTLRNLTDELLKSLDMSEADRTDAVKQWAVLAEANLRDFSERAKQMRRTRYVDPLIDVIGSLPKDELAAVAEALVNITSLRRRVSMDAETVGGPVDVAVISKGDGLVWISRKHYFRQELNQHFFQNYFRGLGGRRVDDK